MLLDVREWVTVGFFFFTFLSNHKVPVLPINKYELWKAAAKARGLYWRWTAEGFMCKWKFLSLLLIGAQWALLFIQTTLCRFYRVHKKNSLFRLWPRVAQRLHRLNTNTADWNQSPALWPCFRAKLLFKKDFSVTLILINLLTVSTDGLWWPFYLKIEACIHLLFD